MGLKRSQLMRVDPEFYNLVKNSGLTAPNFTKKVTKEIIEKKWNFRLRL